MMNGKKVYETSSEAAAATVAARFPGSVTLAPGQEA
jgi:hypothetical protein